MTSIPDYSPDPTLTPQQHRVLTLLACGNTITQAAAAVNIHRNTIGYWRRTHPVFAREQEYALREQRNYWHEQVTALIPQAIRAIEDCLTNPKSSPSLRFRAAALILKMATQPQLGSFIPVAQNAPEIPEPAQECTKGPELASFIPALEAAEFKENIDPASEIGDHLGAKTGAAAQTCTNDTPRPIRLARQPGRNQRCPCNSGLKFKRCCVNQSAAA